jgi:hypothetical protein
MAKQAKRINGAPLLSWRQKKKKKKGKEKEKKKPPPRCATNG